MLYFEGHANAWSATLQHVNTANNEATEYGAVVLESVMWL